jgi:hypothetical protein
LDKEINIEPGKVSQENAEYQYGKAPFYHSNEGQFTKKVEYLLKLTTEEAFIDEWISTDIELSMKSRFQSGLTK